jgi:hypothetical protein
MKKNLFFTIFALLAFAGYGQVPVFQWGAVVKSDVSGSDNPTNAAKGIKTNANGDVFIYGTFSSNATSKKDFTRIITNHYDAQGNLTPHTSAEGAKVASSTTSNNENFFLYKMNRQGQILWQVISDRGYVALHYSQITPTPDGGVFVVLHARLCNNDEFEDKRLLRLVGSDSIKKDVELTNYVTNTQQGVAAKIAADGKVEWVKHIIRVDDALIDGNSATIASYFNGLEIDKDGNYWLCGRYMKAITFDKPDKTTQTLTPNYVTGWNGDSQIQCGDALLVKLNPQGELLWSMETSGTIEYLSINSLQYHDDALYVYGNLAALSDNETSSTSVFGHTLYPTDKTNAWSARLDVSNDEPSARWVTLFKSLPQTNDKGGRIKVTNACYDNGAFFLAGSLTGFIEVNGDIILANDDTSTGTNYLKGFTVRQDPATGEVLGKVVDASAGLAAEIENVAFRQNKIYAFGYTLGVSWLHVYDTDFTLIAEYNFLGAQGATAWDAIFFDNQLITVNRGRQMNFINGYITGAPQAFIDDAPQAYSAYFLSYQLEGLQKGTGIREMNLDPLETVKIAMLRSAIRISGHADIKIRNLSGNLIYSGHVNGEKEIPLTAGIYIVSAKGKATKVLVR